MPLCWIFLLKRRRALSNVSFSPTRTSANPGSPPPACGLASASGARPDRPRTRPSRPMPAESRRSVVERRRGSNAGCIVRRGTAQARRDRRRTHLARRVETAPRRCSTRRPTATATRPRARAAAATTTRPTSGRRSPGRFRELDRRSRIAAWRLRALGLEPGDRLLTWSPSTPELPAAYFGAMRAGVDPRPARPAHGARRDRADRRPGRREAAGHRHRPRRARSARGRPRARSRRRRVDELAAEPDDAFPADWEAQVDALAAARPGTTCGARLHVGHDRHAEGRDAGPRQRPGVGRGDAPGHPAASSTGSSRCCRCRTCSSRPSALFYALDVGADILYVRSRNPRVIFEAIREPPGDVDGRRAPDPRAVLVGDRARGRQVGPHGGLRPAAAASPGTCRTSARRVLFRRVHAQLGGGLRLFVSAGRVPAAGAPAGLGGPRRHRDPGLRRDRVRLRDVHDARGPRPRDGRPADAAGSRSGSPTDGEIQFRGPTLFKGYWHDPEATAAAFTADGWYRTGDIGRFDAGGPPRPHGPDEGHHRAAERPERVPRGHRERAPDRRPPRLRGPRDEARPDRGRRPRRRADVRTAATPEAIRASVDARPASRPRTRPWPRTSGVAGLPDLAGGRLAADPHAQGASATVVRRWAAVDEPLPVREGRVTASRSLASRPTGSSCASSSSATARRSPR